MYNDATMRGKQSDLRGFRSGRLTAIEPHHKDKHNRWHWLCKCDCGNERVVDAGSLKKNSTRSCGCLLREVLKSGDIRRVHGMCGTKLHNAWMHMKSRCYNKNSPDYKKWYGARGIKVCEEWLNDFNTFHDWAITNGYREGLSIDRIDVNGDYCPENCRWVTPREQNRNKRNNKLITCDGETHCPVEWAEILGVDVSVINARVYYGWDDERIIKQPIRKSSKRKKE